jgi:hypothetical protein
LFNELEKEHEEMKKIKENKWYYYVIMYQLFRRWFVWVV